MLRHDAVALLRRLEADRERVDARLTETGRKDPIRELTGRGALDRAVEEVRSLLEALAVADAATAVLGRVPEVPTVEIGPRRPGTTNDRRPVALGL